MSTTTGVETPRSTWRRAYCRTHAWLLSKENSWYASVMDPRKRAFLGELEGTILELGPGGGHNFRYFQPSIHWIGVEPNPYAHTYLLAGAKKAGITAEILEGRGEDIPAPDATVDAVVCTLVLCSVSNPQRVLAEILRVLKPGGTFAFVEHVAAPAGTGMRRVQRMVRPCWKVITDGCHPDRETWRFLEAAGFEDLTIDHFKVAIAFIAPHIAGKAKKPSSPRP